MRPKPVLIGILLIIVSVAGAQAADTVSTSSLSDAVNSVYVSSVTMDPEVFYPDETGTITVELKNSGTMTVTLGSPIIYDPNVEVYNSDSYSSKSRIGGGDTVDYTFKVSVNSSSGKNTVFPIFSVNPNLGNAVHATFPLKTDSSDLQASVTGQPDTFTLDNAGTVNLTLINPRDAAIKNIHISASGDGLAINPSDAYVSSLAALNTTTLGFSVTPSKNSVLTFNISFTSSDNVHSQTVTLPITLGVDKTAAVPVINNPTLSSKGSYYDLTADITNAGVSDAKGLIVSVQSPAKATGTYTEYAVGTLSADDSSSFEITFTCDDLSNVPLDITWKDSSGNNYNVTKVLDLTSGSGTTGTSSVSSSSSVSGISGTVSSGGPGGISGGPGNTGGISAYYPYLFGAILLIIAGVVLVLRKRILARFKRT